ncbi:MAG: ABC transporter permease [Candidatus Heimdallarchaeum endolithica]|uniref:ABC transporter permease n=1 Tax=Candidatus Heimdallarchaeum endolithica TaxID=2876572 RepID=A0A9Y1FM45_9ARCH|nr:MAG: ABC transporter permease [Candidatus Heimdallarchaeum endolithica]
MSNNFSTIFNRFGDFYRRSGLSLKSFIIANHTFNQNLKNKRFYIIFFYFLLPVFGSIFDVLISEPSYYSGKAYAVYQIHQSLNSTLQVWWMSIFGQLFIILIASDAISSEFEKGTILSLKSRPISNVDIFLGKFIGIIILSFILVIPGGFIIYLTQIWTYAPKNFWWVFWHSLDELIVCLLVVILGFVLLLSICFLFSSIFNKSLQATLVSLLVIFAVQLLSSVFSFSDNLMSKFNITRYLQHFLNPVLYNVNTITTSGSITNELIGFIALITILQFIGFWIFSKKEVHQ